MKNIFQEFNNLFYKRIDIGKKLDDIFYSYYIDGRVYWENIADENKPKLGIMNIKKLPTETMDFSWNPITGKYNFFVQYMKPSGRLPRTIEEAEKSEDTIAFYPKQITYIDYGQYGIGGKRDVIGYLEKARQPYNQLKLLETSVVIYRLVRAPERLVFKIDTGSMPLSKAMKFVEQVKQKLQKKVSYDPSTGKMNNAPNVLCIRKNTEIPLLDGRHLTLQQLIDEHNQGIQNWVYSINRTTLNIEPGKIKNALITRPNEKLIRIHFDNNTYLDTTYDHKFILRNNKDIRADELKIGDSCMPLTRENKKLSAKANKYETIYNPKTEKMEYTHKLVVVYTQGQYKNDYVCHHIDFDRYNNSPENLIYMDKLAHWKYHSDMLTEEWKTNPEKRTKAIKKGFNKWLDKNRKYHSEYVTRTNIEQNKVAKMQEVLNTPEIRAKQKKAVSKSKKEWFENPINKENFSKLKTKIIDAYAKQLILDTFIKFNRPKRDDLLTILKLKTNILEHLKEINKNQVINNEQWDHLNKGTVISLVKEMGYIDYSIFKKTYKGEKYPGYENHKVTKIEYLQETDDCGCLEIENNHNFATSQNSQGIVFINNSMLENFFLPQSSDGRGSSIESVGGNPSGFSELDDLHYFQKKLYLSLKYPLSRIESIYEKQSGSVMFSQSGGDISRDETKWGMFLKRHQDKIADALLDVFLLHLDLIGLSTEFDITKAKLNISMSVPNNYISQMNQHEFDQRWNNYNTSDKEEFSKYYRMKYILKMTEEEINENIECLKKDKELGLTPSDE